MRLTELEPEFLRRSGESWIPVASFSEADGLMFLCPACFEKNGGNVGTHRMVCWRPHIPLEVTPGPGRWNFEGTSFEDFTLQPGPLSEGKRSVQAQGGCNAHFHINNGEVTKA